MARLKITTKKFKSLITDIIAETTRSQGRAIYSLTFNDDITSAYIMPTGDSPFYATYIEEFVAITTLYNCSMWFDVKDNKPCLVFIKD